MNEQQKSRSNALRTLLASALGERFTQNHLTKILDAEDQMTENREHLAILSDRGVLSEIEFSKKLNSCFEIFICHAADILGEDACREIYDFVPGERVELVPIEDGGQRSLRNALIIGTAHCRDSRLSDLSVLTYDVARLKAYFSTSFTNYDLVRTMLDAPRERIRRALDENLRKLRRQDSLLLYFAAHGVQDADGDVFLAAEDTNLDDLSETALSIKELRNSIRQSDGRVMVFLDVRNSGPPLPEQLFSSFGDYRPNMASGLVAQSAGSSRQSWQSAFASSFIRGLRGAADSDSDGQIGLLELCNYIAHDVKEVSDVTDLYLWETKYDQDSSLPELPIDDPIVAGCKSETDENIATRAHHLWEMLGCPSGRDVDIWLQAERELAKTSSRTADRLEWLISSNLEWLSATDDFINAIAQKDLNGARLSDHLLKLVLERTQNFLQRIAGGEVSVELLGIGDSKSKWVHIVSGHKFLQAANVLSSEFDLSQGNFMGSVEELGDRGRISRSVARMLQSERISAIAISRVFTTDFANQGRRTPTLLLHALASDSNAFTADLARIVLDQCTMLLGLATDMGQRDENLVQSSKGTKS